MHQGALQMCGGTANSQSKLVWWWAQIVAIMPRRYQLQELGLEIFFTGHGTLFLTFRNKQACRDCLRTLQGLPAVQLQKFRSSKKWTRDWVNGKVGPDSKPCAHLNAAFLCFPNTFLPCCGISKQWCTPLHCSLSALTCSFCRLHGHKWRQAW